jgi:hypothetical protein
MQGARHRGFIYRRSENQQWRLAAAAAGVRIMRSLTGTLPTALRRLSAAVLLALATMPLAGASGAADITPPIVSGLPWRSGAAGDQDLGGWRGSPFDVRVVFIAHQTWEEMFFKTGNKYFKTTCNARPLCVVSLAMFPKNVKGEFQACEAGAFDANYKKLAQNIAAARPTGGLAVRIGWEANGPTGRGYHIRSTADIAPYKACFARIAGILRAARPGVLIDWSNAKKGSLSVNVMETYPGNDVVDIISVHYYDSGPKKLTQAIWDDYANRTYKGGPWGINMWLAEAKKLGRKLGVPEWGLWRNGEPGDPDNPVYIRNMHAFFSANAAYIAYENYHNMGAAHQLYPSTQFPKGRAEYQKLW